MKYVSWVKREFTEEEEKLIRLLKLSFLDLSDFNARILVSRGVKSIEEAKDFLYSDIYNLLDANSMKGSQIFLQEVSTAIKNNDKIVIFNDYDCDGTIAGVIGFKSLNNLNANVSYHCNNRFKEGYGLSMQSVKNIIDKFPDVKLIITVDNGISSFDAIDYCNELGIKVIVTDHHEPLDKIPNALAVVNPKQKDCPYTFKHLCGAGVIFKLMIILYEYLCIDSSYVMDLIDLVGLATIGDVVPLIGENRIMVKESLRKINSSDSKMVFKVIKESLKKDGYIDESYIAFTIVPMINANSRLDGSCYESMRLFLEDSKYFINKSLNILINLNDERKNLTIEQYNIAKSLLSEMDNSMPSCIVLYDESFHEGIIGLIASKVVEEYNRPAVILAKHKDSNILKGSCRSIEGVHIKECLEKSSKFLVKFGGHKGAAGLSLELENLENFRTRMNEVIESPGYDCYENVYIDEVIEKLDRDIVCELNSLAPFGEGFAKPQIGIKDFKCLSMELLKNVHLKITCDNVTILNFNCGVKTFNELYNADTVKAVGFPEISKFRNIESINFIVSNSNIIKATEKDYSNFVIPSKQSVAN